MTVLHSVDFFPSGNASVAIEPRLPQADFPEHHHDFHEIVIVEHGTGIHVFNGQPYTITGGTVCFVRDHDRHLYEHTDNLCLTNVLYRSPDRFQFLAGLNQLLPQEQDGQYPSHWRVNYSVLQQVRQLVAQMEQQEGENDLPSTASREILFMQLLLLLRKLLVIIYTMLKQGTLFDESCFEIRRRSCEQKQVSRYIHELEKRGYLVAQQS